MAAKKKIIRILPPLGGVYKHSSFQDTPVQTCFDARDIFPFDASNGRRRLAVRPGFSAYGSLIDANLLTTLTTAKNETYDRLLMASDNAGTLRGWSGTAWTSSLGSGITTGRTVYAAGYNGVLYIACTTTHRKFTPDATNPITGSPPGVVADWTATGGGTIPPNCQLISLWNARIVLAGDPAFPHIVNFARADDPLDWDFTDTDTGAAIAVSINESVTSLIPHNRECLIVGTPYSLWIFRGDPMKGGTLDRLAHVVGPITNSSWCKTADDWTYMLTRDGLYRMPPGCGAPPISVSREKIPEALLGLDGINYTAFLAYDTRWRGIHIYVEGATPQRYWYDLENEGFWPMTAPGTEIRAIHRYDPADTATTSGVMIGTNEGVMRLNNAQTLGGSDKAYVTIGPQKLAVSPLWKNRLDEALVVLSDLTDDTTGTLDFYVAGSAEEATTLPAARKFSTTIGALINSPRCYPMLAGYAIVVKYSQGSTAKVWAFEELSAIVTAAGREFNP